MSKRLEAAVETLRRNPSLEELREEYPAEWAAVERDIGRLIADEDGEAIKRYLQSLAAPARATSGRRQPEKKLISTEIRRRMAAEALSRAYTAAASGVAAGKRVRFGLVNGYIAQKLLFRLDLERKPASLPAFRLIWPMLRQRRLLMPLVTKRGIYCFYTRQLVAALAELIGDRLCLEIAAGDGTLSRFLTDAGLPIHRHRRPQLAGRRHLPGHRAPSERHDGAAHPSPAGRHLFVAATGEPVRTSRLHYPERRDVCDYRQRRADERGQLGHLS